VTWKDFTVEIYMKNALSEILVVHFLLDGLFIIVVFVPVAYAIARYTKRSFIPMYFICKYIELTRTFVQYIFIRRGAWAKKLI